MSASAHAKHVRWMDETSAESDKPPVGPLRKRLIAATLAVVAIAGLVVWYAVVAGYVFYDPGEPDFGRLFTNVQRASSEIREVDGEIVDVTFYELEPGFSRYKVRERDGSTLDLVLNSSTRIIWPGATEATAAAGMYGEVSTPPMGVDDLVGLTLFGRYRYVTIGPLLYRRSQAFLIDGHFGLN